MKLLFGEWTPDAPDLDAPLSDVENALPYAQHYRSLRSLSPSGQPLPARPLAAISSSVVNGVTETYAATQDALYRFNGATLGWDAVTGTAVSVETPMVWSFVQSGRFVLAASFLNDLRQRQIGGVGNFTAIANGPKARVLGTVREFVVAGDINDPTDGVVNNRVRWSAIGDPLNWPLPGTATAQALQADEQDLKAEHGAVVGIYGTDVGIVMQERAITRMSYVGAPLVFRFDLIDATRGLAARNAAAQVGRTVFFLAEDGFYRTDGSGESQPIGEGKVDRWFMENADPGRLRDVRAFVMLDAKCVIWSFASQSAGDVNDAMLVYNFGTGRWSKALVPASLVYTARSPGFTLEQLDAFGDLDSLTASLDAVVWQGGVPYPAAFTADFRVAGFNGDPLTARLETGAMSLDGPRALVLGVRPLVQGGIGQIALGTQADLGEDVMWTGLRDVNPRTRQADFRVSAFFHRVRMTVAGGFDRAIGIDALMLPDDGVR